MQKGSKKPGSSPLRKLLPPKGRLSEADELRAALHQQEEEHARTLAEFSNYRKRVTKEGKAAAKSAVRELLLDIVSVQDSFDRAFQSEALRDDPQIYQGVRSIQRQVRQLLEKQGVMSFESVGQTFDPTLHEAVDTEPHDRLAEGAVCREVQKGYVWEGKVLRPARVVVVKNQRGFS